MPFLLERLAGETATNTDRHFDLRTAIAAQIQRLVSIRTLAPDDELNLLTMGCESVVDIGLNNQAQLERYARRLARLIAMYEPRLLAPRVHIQATDGVLQPHQLVVSGSLLNSNDAEVFYFELPLH